MKSAKTVFICMITVVLWVTNFVATEQRSESRTYRSPLNVAFSPAGKTLAVTDHTAGKLVLMHAEAWTVGNEVSVHGEPKGLAWSRDGKHTYVSETGTGTVAEVSVESGEVARRFPVGRRPAGLALAAQRGLLLAANQGLNCVSLIDLKTGAEVERIGVVHAPSEVVVSPDESVALVGNLLPLGDARETDHGAVVSVIDLDRRTNLTDIRLPGGSTNLRGMTVSPDGRWAYVVHCIGRFTLPTDHLERGWVNTNALSILDLKEKERYATVLLDRIGKGAANPWGITLTEGGAECWITLSGAQQIARIDLASLHRALTGNLSREFVDRLQKSSLWRRIARDPSERSDLQNDLGALYEAGLIEYHELHGNGPRGLAAAPDGQKLAVALYFSGDVVVMAPSRPENSTRIAMGTQPEADPVRRGEQVFHDATHSFQNWLSCATCHPDARADALNWDLLNDGVGNPKNTHTLVLSHATPPVMSLGVRASMEVAARKGFHFIEFQEVTKADLEAVRTYLESLRPAPSPYLTDKGDLSELARKGKELFEEPNVGCARCHPAPLFTDKEMHDVGTKHRLDRKAAFDTPSLREAWRTAPYLHDGSAETLLDVLTAHNSEDEHGKTSHLSEQELKALCEYMLSL